VGRLEGEQQSTKNNIYEFKKLNDLSAFQDKENEMSKIKLFGKTRTIKKRLDGRWEIRLTHNKKRFSIYDINQSSCIDKFKDFFKNIDRLTATSTEHKIQTLNDWLDIWYKNYKVPCLKKISLESITYCMQKYVNNTLGKLNIKNIKPVQLQELLNNITSSRMRQITKNHLSNAFKYAFKNQIIKDNPMLAVEVKHKTQHRNILTVTQQTQLLNSITNIEYKVLIECYLQTGLRRGEALELKINDIDIDRKMLKVRGTKTESSIREIPISQTLIDKLLKVCHSDNKIFNISRITVNHKFKKLCEKLGFTNITIHSLRHTFATNCLQVAIPMKIVQYWLGHSTITLTSDLYTHVTDEIVQGELSKLHSIFDPNSDPKK
jgi:integrase